MNIKNRLNKLENGNKGNDFCCYQPTLVAKQKECGNCGEQLNIGSNKIRNIETIVILPTSET